MTDAELAVLKALLETHKGEWWTEKLAVALAEVDRLRVGKVRYMHANERTDSQREHACASELYGEGDMVLVWVNEGDLYEGAEEWPVVGGGGNDQTRA